MLTLLEEKSACGTKLETNTPISKRLYLEPIYSESDSGTTTSTSKKIFSTSQADFLLRQRDSEKEVLKYGQSPLVFANQKTCLSAFTDLSCIYCCSIILLSIDLFLLFRLRVKILLFFSSLLLKLLFTLRVGKLVVLRIHGKV